MSERIDRGIRGNRKSLAVIIAIGIASFAGLYLWSLRNAPEPVVEPVLQAKAPTPQTRPEEALVAVSLYYPSGGLLAVEQAGIKRRSGVQAQAREALVALLSEQRVKNAPVLKEVQLRAFYLDASGAAYADLSTDRRGEVRASAWEELVSVYAMVNTLARNFEEIKRVRFLVDGKEAETLAGHLDLSAAFSERMDIVRR